MKRLAKTAAVLVIAAIILSGCPVPRGPSALAPASSQRIYDLPFDRVWDAALAVVDEDLQFPLDVVERSTGLITTEWVTFQRKPGNYTQAETVGNTAADRPLLSSYRVMVLVKITPSGTMVRVRRYEQDWDTRWTPVPTDLQFERQFLILVDRRLGVTF